MEPRLIAPRDVKPGDTVRLTAEYRIVELLGNLVKTDKGMLGYDNEPWSWTLLDRPEPPRERYSLWRCTITGTEYIYLGPEVTNGYMIIKEGKPLPGATGAGVLGGQMLDHPTNTSRLVPLDGGS